MTEQDVINALVKAVELKDQSTAAHTWRVTLYTQAMAEDAGLDRELVDRFMRAAVLHDIGKIDIPSRILSKPGRLTDDEYKVIQSHTVLGHNRLVRMGESDELVLALVRSHHEKLDGSGYPDGLAGDDIPEAARYFAVIDTFDALTSLRPYRSQVGDKAGARAIEELRDKAGLWYCPVAVERFAGLYDSGALDWILHYLNDEKSLVDLPSAPEPEIVVMRRNDLLRQAEAG